MEMDMNKIDAGNSLTITLPKDFTNDADVAPWGTRCLVCGGEILIYSPFDHGYKICDECKRAILKMREYMKED